MRKFVFRRDKGVCADCGKHHRYLHDPWEADHILPLMISLGDPSFWEPENVVILCKFPCHKEKSASDRRKYRKKDRERLKQRFNDISTME